MMGATKKAAAKKTVKRKAAMAVVGPSSQGKKGGSRPGERRGGRVKGTPNKVSKALKDMILGALDGAGGEAYLQRQAETNPSAFLTLVGKVLPTTLTGADGGPILHGIAVTFVRSKK